MNQRLVYFTPLLAALGLGLILYTAIGKDPTKLETARLNDPFPSFSLTALENPGTLLNEAKLVGKIRLVNVWATWCPSCRAEHPYLLTLAQQGVEIVGLNYKDQRDGAQKWLRDLGDPYEFNIFDPEGKLGFNLGVYGAPETYLVDPSGLVRYRHVGELNNRAWNRAFAPLIETIKQQFANK